MSAPVLNRVYSSYSPEGWAVNIKFSDASIEEFRAITQVFQGRRIAIVISGKLVQLPIIHQTIHSGNIQITGDFTESEASKIVNDIGKGGKGSARL
jgi:preprotein translocase subunit SecD